MLKNDYLVAKIGVDTAENELFQDSCVCDRVRRPRSKHLRPVRLVSLPPLQGRVLLRPPKPKLQLGAGQSDRSRVYVRVLSRCLKIHKIHEILRNLQKFRQFSSFSVFEESPTAEPVVAVDSDLQSSVQILR